MTTVYYTDEAFPSSEAVQHVAYDSRTRELVVTMAESDSAYRYKDVPQEFYNALDKVTSVGRNWLPVLKREYGPSERLGDAGNVNFVEVETPDTTAVGTPKALVDNRLATVAHLPMTAAPVESRLLTRFRIHFKVGGQKRKYDLEAESIEDALFVFGEMGDALGLKFKVKKVTVYFD